MRESAGQERFPGSSGADNENVLVMCDVLTPGEGPDDRFVEAACGRVINILNLKTTNAG